MLQKPKTPKDKPISDNVKKHVIDIIAKAQTDKDEKLKDAFKRIDDNTVRSLNASATFYYYLLSINAACIGFIISLTIHNKFNYWDTLIILSLLLWIISFTIGIFNINKISHLSSNFSYYILGETLKIQELIDKHKKEVDDLGNESVIRTKSLLNCFLLGILFFMIWYLIKIFNN
ncbi:hypothetical protein BDD43_2817 [Mucilaginibacter gracilis]|uniref:Uncharacterized protein n=1 Tax=Mucilaginibacter gracilis TaxID=423350 RepID=A0A495J1N8_9SPHI|nr:hypothetical protein [Mucilaginibacter gracilis]RKR82632.1 hypothetical protein BDD43_2817 [Mucilaginibacter gracilis]